ncbi:MAG: glycosyltransferase family 39 protein, partial [Planctomycetota bacterium]
MSAGEFPNRRGWLRNPWVHVALLFFLAFFVRLQHLSEAARSPFFPRLNFLADAVYYHKWAGEIAEGDLLGRKVFYLAPLYPYTRAIPFYLTRKAAPQDSAKEGPRFQYSDRTALTWQCVVGALSACLIYAIGSFLGGHWVGLLAGFLAAFYRMFIYFDALLMPSTQLLFVNLAAVLLLLHAGRKGNWLLWLGAGVFVGLAVLAKAPAFLFLPAGFFWIFFGIPGLSRRRRIRNFLLLSLPTVLMVATVTARNWVVAHDLVFLTANAGTNLYLGNHPEANGAH